MASELNLIIMLELNTFLVKFIVIMKKHNTLMSIIIIITIKVQAKSKLIYYI